MSDFTSNFWSIYVVALTLGGIFGCLLLLWMTARKKVESAADNTTGHVWDEDLREMNNPMPRWWMWMFVITSIFGLGYLAVYPGLGKFAGQLGWSTKGQYEAEVAKANQQLEPLYARFSSMKPEEVAADAQAMEIGERLFMNNCSQCHGSDARGGKGFPDLTDKQWNWGGTPDQIEETITKGRTGMMPPMAAAVGSPEDVRNVANYVLSLSGAPNDSVRANLGRAKFVVCAACHGADGKGNPALGAPNLTSGVFMHGPAVESHIVAMITNGKTGVMPAWDKKFTPEQIKLLTAYVWGKGGGVAPPAAN